LFQFLIISFNDPAVFGHLDQSLEPVFGGFFLPSRPLDRQPFLGMRFRFLVIPMSCAHANGGKAGSQLPIWAFTPGDFPESRGGQAYRQLLYGDGLMVRGPL
jgi:hypothetical protein